MADDEPLHLEEVDHDPFADEPAHLEEVDHDPFAQPQVPVITVHPRSSAEPTPQQRYRMAQAGDESAMPAFERSGPSIADIPGALYRGYEAAREAAPHSPADLVTQQFTNLASVPGQVDEATRAAHHLMYEPALPPPEGSYTLDDGYTYPGRSDPAEWEAFARDQETRRNFVPEMALNLAGGGMGMAKRGALGMAGGRLIQPAAPQILRRAELVTPEGYAINSRDYTKRAREIMDEIQAGAKGAGPIDLSRPAGPTSQVPQVPLERYVPPRGISARMQAAMENPEVARGVDESIQRGIGMGADRWYHTYPMREAWIDELGAQEGNRAFDEYMSNVGGSSPRSNAVANARNASYYYLQGGRDLPDTLPYPYGHVAQQLHRQNYETIYGKGWDLFRNPKPPSFIENLRGNLIPVTGDTHAFRNIGMRTGDPRFLESSLRDLLKNEDPGEAAMAARFGEVSKGPKGPVVTYRPQQLYESGRLSPEEAQRIPRFWASQPNPNEYAAVEQYYTDRARAAGLQPAEGQSAAWSGAGELTGLDTPPTHTFPEIANERITFTSKMRHEKPEDTLRYLIRRQKPLLGIGGAAAAAPSIRDFLDEPAPRRYSAGYNPA